MESAGGGGDGEIWSRESGNASGVCLVNARVWNVIGLVSAWYEFGLCLCLGLYLLCLGVCLCLGHDLGLGGHGLVRGVCRGHP